MQTFTSVSKMNGAARRGYNAALRAVGQRISERIQTGGLNIEERRTLATVVLECRKLRQQTRQKPRLATFAARYGVSLRTVKNWKRVGCPFGQGRIAVLSWMLSRRYLPEGPRRKFSRELRELAFAKTMAAFREAKDAARHAKDETAIGNLALRLRLAFEAMEPLDGESILRKSRDFSKLAKAAVQYGFWK